jgi:hypothetical protein
LANWQIGVARLRDGESLRPAVGTCLLLAGAVEYCRGVPIAIGRVLFSLSELSSIALPSPILLFSELRSALSDLKKAF